MSDQTIAETSPIQHTTRNRQITMPPRGFEPTILAGGRPETYCLDRAATRTGHYSYTLSNWTAYMSLICKDLWVTYILAEGTRATC
jgi:hypothetical protein